MIAEKIECIAKPSIIKISVDGQEITITNGRVELDGKAYNTQTGFTQDILSQLIIHIKRLIVHASDVKYILESHRDAPSITKTWSYSRISRYISLGEFSLASSAIRGIRHRARSSREKLVDAITHLAGKNIPVKVFNDGRWKAKVLDRIIPITRREAKILVPILYMCSEIYTDKDVVKCIVNELTDVKKRTRTLDYIVTLLSGELVVTNQQSLIAGDIVV